MTKLNDTQLILLSTAVQRDDGSLLPISSTITMRSDRVRKMISALISQGFALETSVSSANLAVRSDGDDHFGAAITDAGRAAIGVGSASWIKAAEPAVQREVKRTTKSDNVLSLLHREKGATLAELVEATGWLATKENSTKVSTTPFSIGRRLTQHSANLRREGSNDSWATAHRTPACSPGCSGTRMVVGCRQAIRSSGACDTDTTILAPMTWKPANTPSGGSALRTSRLA